MCVCHSADIPLSKAVAGVRVGLVDGEFLVNPTIEQQSRSPLDLVIAGTADAILMIEGFCDFLSEEQMLEVLSIPCKDCRRLQISCYLKVECCPGGQYIIRM